MIRSKTAKWLGIMAIAIIALSCQAGPDKKGRSSSDAELLRDSIVDAEALNYAAGDQTRFAKNINGRTFQQYPLVTYKGYQYATYYDKDRRVCVARRPLPEGEWDVIRFQDYLAETSDAHNVAVIGIAPGDGTIHLAFDHHAEELNYRVSELGAAENPESVEWTADLFGPVEKTLGKAGPTNSVTYPRFIPAPTGDLFLYYRHGSSGNGDGAIQEYKADTHTWTEGLGLFISRGQANYAGEVTPKGTRRNPYLNTVAFAGSRLHVTWLWREAPTKVEHNHDICYAYSDDFGRTWHNNAGEVIGKTGEKLINLLSPGLVVASVPQGGGLFNQMAQYAFEDGSVHVMTSQFLEGTTEGRIYHHYWRNPEGQWHKQALTHGGSRPKMVGNSDHELFLVYSSGQHINIDKGVPNKDRTQWFWSTVHTIEDVASAGEGLIDQMRWEEEGVLSIYDQEPAMGDVDYGDGKPVDGTPSAIHVYDFDVSQGSRIKTTNDPAPLAVVTPYAPIEQPKVIVPVSASSSAGQAKLVARWSFDEGRGSVVTDSVNGIQGKVVGAQWVEGVTGKALSFDGVDSYVEIQSPEVTGTITDGVTISAWLKTEQPADGRGFVGTVVHTGLGDVADTYAMYLHNSKGQVGIMARGVEPLGLSRGAADILDNTWHHVAVAWDGNSRIIYADGVEVAREDDSRGSIMTAVGAPLMIGSGRKVGADDFAKRLYIGAMDDVRIYDGALTASEIASLATPKEPAKLVARWSFDEGQGAVVTDSVNGIQGKIVGAQWVEGVTGKALSFDGFTSYVEIESPEVTGTITDGVTISAWLKTEKPADGRGFVGTVVHTGLGEVADTYAMYLHNSKGQVGIMARDVEPLGLSRGAADILDNTWHHVAVAWDGNSRIIYADGVEVAREDDSRGSIMTAVGAPLMIGSGRKVGADDFAKRLYIGDIDEVSIYDGALTADEIADLSSLR